MAANYRKGDLRTGVSVATAASARRTADGVQLQVDLSRTGNAAFLGRMRAELLDAARHRAGHRCTTTWPSTAPCGGGWPPRRRTAQPARCSCGIHIDTEREDLPPGGALPRPPIDAADPRPSDASRRAPGPPRSRCCCLRRRAGPCAPPRRGTRRRSGSRRSSPACRWRRRRSCSTTTRDLYFGTVGPGATWSRPRAAARTPPAPGRPGVRFGNLRKTVTLRHRLHPSRRSSPTARRPPGHLDGDAVRLAVRVEHHHLHRPLCARAAARVQPRLAHRRGERAGGGPAQQHAAEQRVRRRRVRGRPADGPHRTAKRRASTPRRSPSPSP